MHWNIKTFYPGGFLKRCMFVSCMKNSTALWSPFVRQIGTSWTGTGSIVGIGPVLRQGQASSVGIWPVHGTGTGLFWPFPVPVGQVWYSQHACPTGTSTTCPNLPVLLVQVVLVPVGASEKYKLTYTCYLIHVIYVIWGLKLHIYLVYFFMWRWSDVLVFKSHTYDILPLNLIYMTIRLKSHFFSNLIYSWISYVTKSHIFLNHICL